MGRGRVGDDPRGIPRARGVALFSRTPDLKKYTRDLEADKALVAANRQFLFWMISGMVLPAVLGGLLTWTWTGVLLGFLWGGLVRIFLVHHVTWSVNSVCHLWGTPAVRERRREPEQLPGRRRWRSGEGWHNNHHAFPTVARHGLRWWEVDVELLGHPGAGARRAGAGHPLPGPGAAGEQTARD